uniref:Uncharacterized protein n=1 Tax=Rhizophora mucronata TaxID=61149 RepID=A0A2P2IN13_RHIMU
MSTGTSSKVLNIY